MKCGLKCEIWSRVCGYHRPLEQWNRGKKEEFSKRKNYMVPAGGSLVADTLSSSLPELLKDGVSK